MIDHLKRVDTINMILENYDDKALNELYLRVFNSKDGEFVLQDMANRFHVYTHTNREFDEGQRSVWLSIQTRLLNAITVQKEQENE